MIVKHFRALVLLALDYAIKHTQNEFEKTVFENMRRSIKTSGKTVLCETSFVKQALTYGFKFTHDKLENLDFELTLVDLESEKESLIHV